jgi:RimJ/RimL family protein N-acetyltransferase
VIELPLQTARLRIRPFEPANDAAALHELWGDAEAMRFVPGAAQETVDGTRARLQWALDRAPPGWGFWAVEEREGRLIGGAGLFPEAWEGPEVELAYHVVPSAWSRGYATEAGAALLDAAWRETDLDQVLAFAFEGNRASRRVMEKLRMHYEGHVDYRGYNVVRYAVGRPR